jgi:hypothetical protein
MSVVTVYVPKHGIPRDDLDDSSSSSDSDRDEEAGGENYDVITHIHCR